MSARSSASVSVVGMTVPVAARHRFFDLLVKAQCEPAHLRQIAFEQFLQGRGLGLCSADEQTLIHFILDRPCPGLGGGARLEQGQLLVPGDLQRSRGLLGRLLTQLGEAGIALEWVVGKLTYLWEIDDLQQLEMARLEGGRYRGRSKVTICENLKYVRLNSRELHAFESAHEKTCSPEYPECKSLG